LYSSEEMFCVFRLRPGALVPTYDSFLRLVHPDDKSRPEGVTRVLYGGRNVGFDRRVVRPDGAARYVHAWYEVPYGEAQRPDRLATIHEVTDRKALEKQLEHRAFHAP